MTAVKDTIRPEIAWFNAQIADLNTTFVKWLEEDGHDVKNSEKKITNREGPSGEYATSEYTLIIDDALKITLVPYGIWIVAAKGRVDILGPFGSEKLLYLNKEGPVTVRKPSAGSYHEKGVYYDFNDIDENGWYWLDDSGLRKMVKVTKEVVPALLGRLH
jgi:hypothetical protein